MLGGSDLCDVDAEPVDPEFASIALDHDAFVDLVPADAADPIAAAFGLDIELGRGLVDLQCGSRRAVDIKRWARRR
jgi:hypothetical protein